MKKIVIADKNKTDFDPANPEPEFDPSKESYTTVPSEIQALTPQQQHHIMKTCKPKTSALVGKEMKEAFSYLSKTARDDVFYAETSKLSVEEKTNNPDYKFYVLSKDNTKIHSGWEYKEDALDAKKDCPDSTGKIYQRAGLKKLGIDPDNNDSWKVGDSCTGTTADSEEDFEDEEEAAPSLKEEMLSFLDKQYGAEGKDDAEVAIYYFATDFHSGQASELYSILSTSPYSPGPNSSLESEGDIVQMMYSDLEQEFGKRV